MKLRDLALFCATACSHGPAPVEPTPPVARVRRPVEPAALAEPKAAVEPQPPDPCPALAADEISDDETPSIAGTSKWVTAGEWLTARGVSKTAFRAWVRSRDRKYLDESDADALFESEQSCRALTVGDPNEDALACTLAVRTSIMRFSAVAFVVRKQRVVAVLDVGYALPAMDWPDSRWLDLQLTFSGGGLEADLTDRAKQGTMLVNAPSNCHAHFAKYLACERGHRDGVALDDLCPLMMASGGQTSFGHWSPTPSNESESAARVPLRGCAEALPALDALVSESTGEFTREFREDRAFAIKSCRSRGHYVWKGGRFVRSRPDRAWNTSAASE